MTLTQLNELRKQRAAIVTKAGEILTKAHNEKRAITPEEEQEWEARHKEGDEIAKRIEREQRQMDAEAAMVRAIEPIVGQPDTDTRASDGAMETSESTRADIAKRSRWMQQFIRTGMEGMDGEGARYMRSQWNSQHRDTNSDGQSTAVAAGGYTIAPDITLYSQLELALKQYTWFDQAGCSFLTTATGADMPQPTANDTDNEGVEIAENTQIDQQNITFSQITLKAFMYTSKIVRVSFQLLQDSAVNVDQVVGELLGTRLGRIFARRATTGTATTQPQGIAYAATSGKTAASATAITFLELLDLKHSVDPAYRVGPSVRWMFHDSTLKALKKIVDTYGRPLWQPGFSGYSRNQADDTIDGDKYVVNQNMAEMTASAKSVLYGDFSKFKIRRVLNTQILRLTERYADYLEVGFLGFARFDSRLLDAGTHPIKALTQAAS